MNDLEPAGQLERYLASAEDALRRCDWTEALDRAEDAIGLDPTRSAPFEFLVRVEQGIQRAGPVNGQQLLARLRPAPSTPSRARLFRSSVAAASLKSPTSSDDLESLKSPSVATVILASMPAAAFFLLCAMRVGLWATAPLPSLADAACTPVSIAIGQSVNGKIEAGDCIASPRLRGSRADRYSFQAEGGQQLAIGMQGRFDTYLALIGPDGEVVAENDDSDGTNARIQVSVADRGTYTIEALARLPRAGGVYVLSIEEEAIVAAGPTGSRAVPGCIPLRLAIGASVNGALTNGDCATPRRADAKADTYTFRGSAGQRVVITLRGSFDPFLSLLGPGNRLLAVNDDSDGRNSRIEMQLPGTATYTIEASAAARTGRGAYTLSLTEVGGGGQAGLPGSARTATGSNVTSAGSTPRALPSTAARSAGSTATAVPRVEVTTADRPADQRYPFSLTIDDHTTGPATSLTVARPASGRIRVRAPSVFLDQDFDAADGERLRLPPALPVRVGVNRGDCVVSINGTRVRQALPATLRMVPGQYRLEFSCETLGKQWAQQFTVGENGEQTQSAIGRVP